MCLNLYAHIHCSPHWYWYTEPWLWNLCQFGPVVPISSIVVFILNLGNWVFHMMGIGVLDQDSWISRQIRNGNVWFCYLRLRELLLLWKMRSHWHHLRLLLLVLLKRIRSSTPKDFTGIYNLYQVCVFLVFSPQCFGILFVWFRNSFNDVLL